MPNLILTRKKLERIKIGDEVIVTVVAINRNQVRIGIEAPMDTLVWREEIAPKPPTREVREAS